MEYVITVIVNKQACDNCAGFSFIFKSFHSTIKFTFGGEIQPNEWLSIISAFENRQSICVPNIVAKNNCITLRIEPETVTFNSHSIDGCFENESQFIFHRDTIDECFGFIKNYIHKYENKRYF